MFELWAVRNVDDRTIGVTCVGIFPSRGAADRVKRQLPPGPEYYVAETDEPVEVGVPIVERRFEDALCA